MRRSLMLLGFLIVGIGCSGSDDSKKDPKIIDKSLKDTVVEFDDLKSKPPESWKEEPPSMQDRLYQFKLPRMTGDSDDAVVFVFRFPDYKGTVQDDVSRWKKQVLPPEGKSADDISKVSDMKVQGCKVTIVDSRGIYLDGPPMMAAEKRTKRQGWRVVAVRFDAPRKVYHVMFRGPEATVEKHYAEFENWLKSFK